MFPVSSQPTKFIQRILLEAILRNLSASKSSRYTVHVDCYRRFMCSSYHYLR